MLLTFPHDIEQDDQLPNIHSPLGQMTELHCLACIGRGLLLRFLR